MFWTVPCALSISVASLKLDWKLPLPSLLCLWPLVIVSSSAGELGWNAWK